MAEPSSKKRKADKQLDRDDLERDEEEVEEEPQPMAKASAEEMKKRTIFRLKPSFQSKGSGLFKGIATSGPSSTSPETKSFGSGTGGFGSGGFGSGGFGSGGFGATGFSFGSAASSGTNFFSKLQQSSSPQTKPLGTPKKDGEEKAEDKEAEAKPAAPTTPDAAKKADAPAEKAADAKYSFTAPTSFGQKFALPSSWGANAAATPDKAGGKSFLNFSHLGENQMKQTATEVANTPNTRDAMATPQTKASEASDIFTPATTTFKTPSTAVKLEAVVAASAPAVGEENEEEVYSNQALLLLEHGKDKSWTERGTGYLKVNKEKDGEKSRILMWRKTTNVLLLNESIAPASGFKLVQKDLPADAKAFSMLVLDADTKQNRLLCVKSKKPGEVRELYDVIKARQEAMAKAAESK